MKDRLMDFAIVAESHLIEMVNFVRLVLKEQAKICPKKEVAVVIGGLTIELLLIKRGR